MISHSLIIAIYCDADELFRRKNGFAPFAG
jgi:hypothetical protein